jgi:hypothetical protein
VAAATVVAAAAVVLQRQQVAVALAVAALRCAQACVLYNTLLLGPCNLAVLLSSCRCCVACIHQLGEPRTLHTKTHTLHTHYTQITHTHTRTVLHEGGFGGLPLLQTHKRAGKTKMDRHPPTHRLSIVAVTTILRPLCSCRRSLSGRFLLPLPGDFTTQLLLDLVAQDGRCLHTRHTHACQNHDRHAVDYASTVIQLLNIDPNSGLNKRGPDRLRPGTHHIQI